MDLPRQSVPVMPVTRPRHGSIRARRRECHERPVRSLPSDARVALRLHVPFCPKLCWFCACRTQIAKSADALEVYVDALIREIDRVAEGLPAGVKVSRVLWRGGSPAVLPVALIRNLAKRTRERIPFVGNSEFRVEIDSVSGGQDRIDALMAAGMTHARLGVQDFNAETAAVIGAGQTSKDFLDLVGRLRGAGAPAIEVGLLFGLPRQTLASLSDTCAVVLGMAPDRLDAVGLRPCAEGRETSADDPGGSAARNGRPARAGGTGHAASAGGRIRAGAASIFSLGLTIRWPEPARPGGCAAVSTAIPKIRSMPSSVSAPSSISRFRQGYVQNPISTTRYCESADAFRSAPAWRSASRTVSGRGRSRC